MNSDVDGRSIVVVGGASGIGEASARLLARGGARVVVCGPDVESAERVRKSIEAEGGWARAVAADVRAEAEVTSAMTRAVADLQGLDGLVVSSGIQRYGTVIDTEPDVWDDVFATNVRGAYLAARAALPHLRASGHGAIVLVSSIQAISTQTKVAAYTASKGALTALVRSMAVDEAAHRVRVNAVCPGSVDTPMLRGSAKLFSDGTNTGVESTLRGWGRAHPLGRVATSDEVAEVISFLLSDRASFVTGESVRVDGGLSALLPAALPDADGPD